MNPLLKSQDFGAVAERLRQGGDEEAAKAIEALAGAVARQDGALRDLVADARKLEETWDEGGVHHAIETVGGFNDLLAAFGYTEVRGRDRRAAASAADEDALAAAEVWLSPLEVLEAAMDTEGLAAEVLQGPEYRPVEVGYGDRARVIYVFDRQAEVPAGPSP